MVHHEEQRCKLKLAALHVAEESEAPIVYKSFANDSLLVSPLHTTGDLH